MINSEMTKRVVIALGGNAINLPSQEGSFKEQYDHIRTACVPIIKLVKSGVSVMLTHGSGPQVGSQLIKEDLASSLMPPMPMDICAAMVQGQMGFMIQQAISNSLADEKVNAEVVTVVSRVLVNRDDPAFSNPSKPVGPFYTRDEAEKNAKKWGYVIKQIHHDSHKSCRRVVPCPRPLFILEKNMIRQLVDQGFIVIACGGGGIPVYIKENGHLHGIEAVIDKDLCAAKLAEEMGAHTLMILTDVPFLLLNYGKSEAKPITSIDSQTLKVYLEEGHFLEGTMKPKVEACIQFLEKGGERAIIASLTDVAAAFEGSAGTQIRTSSKNCNR